MNIDELIKDLSIKVDGIETKVSQDFNKKLFDYLKGNLNKLGYPILHDDLAKDFILKRITRCCISTDPYIYAFYMDYIDDDNRGLYIGEYRYLNQFSDDFPNAYTTLEIQFKEI